MSPNLSDRRIVRSRRNDPNQDVDAEHIPDFADYTRYYAFPTDILCLAEVESGE